MSIISSHLFVCPNREIKKKKAHGQHIPSLLFFLLLHTIITISLHTYIRTSLFLLHHQIVKEIGRGITKDQHQRGYM